MQSPKDDPPTIESVTLAFDTWRSNRKSTREQTPKELRQKALTLLETHRVSHVINALGLNSTTLKSWKKKHNGSDATPSFISLPTSRVEEVNQPSQLTITLRSDQGSEIIVSGDLSPAQLTALVQGLQLSQGGRI